MSTRRIGRLRPPRVPVTPPGVTAVAVSLVLSLSQAPGLRAQETTNEDALIERSLGELLQIEVVSGASRHQEKVTQAPAPVTIVTAADIQAFGYRTLGDVLGGLRGMYVSCDRNYTYLGNRGFSPPGDYNSRVLVLVDGHRLNDIVYEQAPLGQELPIDLSIIDRIEVIRGPSSSVYGTSAFFAVINLITRQGSQLDAVEVASRVGSLGDLGTTVTLGGQLPGGGEYLAHGGLYHNPGYDRLYYPEFDAAETNAGWAVDADGEGAQRLFTSLHRGDWTLRGSWGRRDKTIPTASYGTMFNDDRTRSVDERFLVEAVRDWQPNPAIDAQVRLRWDRYEYRGEYIYDYGDVGSPDPVTNHDRAVGDWAGVEAHLGRLIHGKHELLLGAEAEYARRADQANWDREVYLDDHRRAWSTGMYAQADIALCDHWLFNAGLRHDVYETFGGTTNPRVAFIHTPSRATTVKFLFGRAFRAPNSYELRYGDGSTQRANPSLGPERITSLELDLEQGLGSHVRTTASVFRYQTRGLITLERDALDSLLSFRNGGAVDAWGGELEAVGQWGGWRARTSWAFQQSTSAGDDQRLVNSPRHLVRATVAIPIHTDASWIGVEWRYTSPRRTLQDTEVAGYVVTNLTLTHQFRAQGLLISAGAKNVLDARYSDPASQEHSMAAIAQDRRTLFLESRVRF